MNEMTSKDSQIAELKRQVSATQLEVDTEKIRLQADLEKKHRAAVDTLTAQSDQVEKAMKTEIRGLREELTQLQSKFGLLNCH